jgi:hypothetical protein
MRKKKVNMYKKAMVPVINCTECPKAIQAKIKRGLSDYDYVYICTELNRVVVADLEWLGTGGDKRIPEDCPYGVVEE